MWRGLNSLFLKFLLVLVPGVVLVAGATLALFAFHTEAKLSQALDERLRLVAATSATSLAEPLWTMDHRAVLRVAESLSTHPEIRCVAISETALGERWGIPNRDCAAEGPHRPRVELPVVHQGGEIGRLLLVYSTESLRERANEELVQDSILLLVLVSALLISALLAYRLCIGVPLRRFMAAMQIGGDTPAQVDWRSADELGRAIAAYNDMAEKVESRARELIENANLLEHSLAQIVASEKRLRAVLDSSPVPTLVAAREDDRLLYLNQPACDMLGLSNGRAGEIGLADLLGGEERRRLIDQIELNGRVDGLELPLRMGGTAWVAASATQTEFDGQSAIFAGFIDVSQHKQHEEELNRARAAAEDASRVKSEFLAVMSHEIRTPMNGILGMTQLVLDTDLSADQRNQLETIQASGEALLTILNDILDFSKLEAGRIDFEAVAFDLPRTIESVLALMQSKADEKSLTLTRSIDPAVARYVLGDPGRLRQVLLNLIGNALKFTEMGGIEVLVDTPREGWLRFAVKDTGIGIPPEAQERLFTLFSQADSSISRRFGGTGLGLAICKRIIELQGGSIGVHSAPGRGSTFWFQLPLTATTAPLPARRTAALADEVRPSRPLSLLLAEDNPVNQRVAVGILEKLGYRVRVAANGREAVSAAQAQAFDAILMDVQMPEMDGLTATRTIRAEPGPNRNAPIIALTAAVTAEDSVNCLDAGMDDFVTKPFRGPDLIKVLLLWVERKRAEAAVG